MGGFSEAGDNYKVPRKGCVGSRLGNSNMGTAGYTVLRTKPKNACHRMLMLPFSDMDVGEALTRLAQFQKNVNEGALHLGLQLKFSKACACRAKLFIGATA